MVERILFVVWSIWLLGVFLVAARVFAFHLAHRLQDRRWRAGSVDQRRVALIVPVKGFDLYNTPRFFDSIFDQAYGDYRVIVTFETWREPVARWLADRLDLDEQNPVWRHPDDSAGLKDVTLVCAGAARSEGQKVHNQIAAFAHLETGDAIVAFADVDIQCKRDWLARLVAPVNWGTHRLATTYRWLIPKRPTLPNQLASVINGSVTTQGGWESTNVLWGGSMALAREVFDEVGVPSLLSGSLNDDLRISKAARGKGHRVAFVRSLVLPTLVDFDWKSFIEFARRQYTQVKFFSPILYGVANLALGLYVLGSATIVAALMYGYFYAWIPIAAAYVIDQFRGLARQQIYLSLFPENDIRRKLFAACWLEHMLTPLWMILHWLLLVSTWTQDRITWAGVRYQIVSKSRTRILGREAIDEKLPVGAPGLALVSALHDHRRALSAPAPSQDSPVAAPAAGRADVPLGADLDPADASEFTAAPEMSALRAETRPDEAEAELAAPPDTAEAVEDPAVAVEAPPVPAAGEKLAHPGGPSAVRALASVPPKRPASRRTRKRPRSTRLRERRRRRCRANARAGLAPTGIARGSLAPPASGARTPSHPSAAKTAPEVASSPTGFPASPPSSKPTPDSAAEPTPPKTGKRARAQSSAARRPGVPSARAALNRTAAPVPSARPSRRIRPSGGRKRPHASARGPSARPR